MIRYFRLKLPLQQQIAVVHEEKKPFKCEVCDMGFAKKDHLNFHKIATHIHHQDRQQIQGTELLLIWGYIKRKRKAKNG